MVTKEEREEKEAKERGFLDSQGLWEGKGGVLYGTLCAPCVLCAKANEILCVPCMSILFWRCIQPIHSSLCCCIHWPYEDSKWNGPRALGDGCVGFKTAYELDQATDWVRIHELDAFKDKKPQLFEGKIEPEDLTQGELGNCWLAAALASAAMHPDLIRAAFLTKEYNPRGRYDVRLFDLEKKEFVVVTVDDLIPCKKGTKEPRFMKPNRHEAWAMIMEKAFAKHWKTTREYGSYSELNGGMAKNAWTMLTGDYVHQFTRPLASTEEWNVALEHKDKDSRGKYSSAEMWRLVKRYTQTKALCAASSHPNADQKSRIVSRGIVTSHAYSILDARDAVTGATMGMGGTKWRLVRLRNPWGRKEWNGAWSDRSKIWDDFKDLKASLHVDDSDDGIFWMSWSDFCDIFDRIDICDRNTRNDLSLDPHEEDGYCGLPYGWCGGCASFWCCCKGPATLYSGRDSSSLILDASEDKATCNCCAAQDGTFLEMRASDSRSRDDKV